MPSGLPQGRPRAIRPLVFDTGRQLQGWRRATAGVISSSVLSPRLGAAHRRSLRLQGHIDHAVFLLRYWMPTMPRPSGWALVNGFADVVARLSSLFITMMRSRCNLEMLARAHHKKGSNRRSGGSERRSRGLSRAALSHRDRDFSDLVTKAAGGHESLVRVAEVIGRETPCELLEEWAREQSKTRRRICDRYTGRPTGG